MFSAISDRVFTELDAVRIARLGDGAVPPTLLDDLDAGEIVPSTAIPADVVTMNSEVTCEDEVSGETHRLTLVYPPDADVDKHKVSVLAPVGTALLGLSVGQSIDWNAPGGRSLRLCVTGISYQPEAAGDFSR